MKKMISLALGVVLIAGFAIVADARQSTPQEPKKPSDAKEKRIPTEEDKIVHKALMAKKLALSQDLLKALVLNDLPEAKVRAEGLIKLRKDAAWMMKVRKDQLEDYEIFSRDFTRSAEKIIKAADARNLDGAKFGYLEMTHACFNCHAASRDLLEIRFELPTADRRSD